ncbi:UDP-glucose dehydrogenase family protein [Streptomyces chartreusis]|uniref:UDP-glucose dehydrogenase family protein n=1 Tax=Streptomyces chartreusis TaxID=1969 RepID=UPI00123CEDBA|nr:UDP-glucose/GDP-mannose dehydrogenase family protein [Streptomyces chartreusis]QEV72950.1 UDP-glucose/GDP-mannose dehydrogenase family protein [Streptomyces chartreusis]
MHRHTIAVIGTGYVGLTAGACLASLGHRVVCADLDPVKVAELGRGEVRILEDGLPELVRAGLDTGRLRFVVGAPDAVRGARTVFICVGTPTGPDGRADLTAVDAVVEEIRTLLEPDSVLVTKSTVPVGTAARVTAALGRPDVGVVSNPEFLREGTSVADFLQPDRVVIGSASPWAAAQVAELYAGVDAPVVIADAASAEVVKYAANCFLAVKLSYVNTLAELCEEVGADIGRVTAALGQDHRIGGAFLRPGPGWGGSCLPKDTRALLGTADALGVDFPLVRAAIDTNARQRTRIADRIARLCGDEDGSLAGVRIGLLGLTFKAGTDDLRDSPALALAAELAGRGAELTAHDPAVPATRHTELPADINVVDDPHQAAKGASALVLCTEWPHYRDLDWPRIAADLHHPVVVDTRNHLDPAALSAAGLAWHGTGTSPVEPALTAV